METRETLDRNTAQRAETFFSDAAPVKSQDVDESADPYTDELVTENGRAR